MQALKERLVRESRTDLFRFTLSTMPTFEPADFHKRYYGVLTKFVHKEIKKLMVFMPPQHGKEISDNQIIPTPLGLKRHGDLRVGDYVFGRDGSPVIVQWVSPKTRSEYVITFSDGSQVECHGNHEWVVFDRSQRKERTIETKYIASQKVESGTPNRRGHRYRFQVDSNVCVQFAERDTKIDPYTLGAWLGDGCAQSGIIHVGGVDTEIVSNTPYDFHENRGSTTRRFYSPEFFSLLKRYRLLNNKHIPKNYIFNSVEVRKQLIAGLIDTDGYVYSKNGRVTISNTNKDVVDKAAFILRSLGQSVVVSKFEPKTSSSGIEGKKVCYQLCFNPTIDFPTVVPRKKIARLVKNKRRAIVSIERKDGLGYGNCIQVEGGVYLVGDTFVPTHNSEGSTRRLPAFLLGQSPDTRVAIVSYNAPKARKFNREIQRIIDTPEYQEIFPDTCLNSSNVTTVAGSWIRNADECEIVGHLGGFKTVGVGGALTGEPVDVLIMDDIYKDAKTAWSSTVRESVSDWYDTVAETRLHNNSQQLIVFTRWHEDDLAGTLLRQQGEYHPTDNPNGWVVVIYQAIKQGMPTEYDPRQEGEALWEERHNIEKLEAIRKRNPHVFDSLYQQDPKPSEGLMYDIGFTEYQTRPATSYCIRKAYVDTADTGADYLCAIVYDETEVGNYLVDVLYTQKPMEYTETALARMLSKHQVQECIVESNNGGRGFQRAVEKQCRLMGNAKTKFKWFHQTDNKEVRININSAAVQNLTFMPQGWISLFPEFASAINSYMKIGKNAHDDAPDALTGTIEKRKNRTKSDVAGLFGR